MMLGYVSRFKLLHYPAKMEWGKPEQIKTKPSPYSRTEAKPQSNVSPDTDMITIMHGNDENQDWIQKMNSRGLETMKKQ